MPSGSALSELLDFYATTGPVTLTSPESIVNEAQEPSYVWNWLMSGDATDRLQGGQRIQDFIMFDAGNTAQFYLPGATRNWSNPQVLTNHIIDWRFLEDHMSFVDAEVELQAGGLSPSAKFQVYKRIIRKAEKRLATSLSNKLESAFFAQPNATTMEGTTASATDPYSIFTFVNNFAGSTTAIDTANIYGTASDAPNGFTTVANISPSTESKWRCAKIGYDGTAAIDTSTDNASGHSLLKAFSAMVSVLNYDQLPYKPGEATTQAMPNDYAIFCTLSGRIYFESMQRASSDHFRAYPQDPSWTGNAPTFAGIPVKRCSAMESAYVWPSSGTTAPAVGSGAAEFDSIGPADPTYEGPNYLFLAREWVKPVFHSSRYFYMRPEIVPSAQPDVTVKVVNSWYNLFIRSKRKLGCVYPVTNDVTL